MELATARQSPVHRLWTFLWIPLPEGSAGWPLPVGNQGRKPTRQRLVIPTRGTPLGIPARDPHPPVQVLDYSNMSVEGVRRQLVEIGLLTADSGRVGGGSNPGECGGALAPTPHGD